MSMPGMGAREIHGISEEVPHAGYNTSAPTQSEDYVPAGRRLVEMSEREIQMETLYWLRMTGAALQEMQKVGPMGMIKAMMSNGK